MGPATSAGIGVAGIVVGIAAAAVSVPRIIVAGVLWISMINILLAVFNLAPAAPLDGGRILRAWLWYRSGDRTAATIKAAHAGRVFAWLLMVAGFAEFAAGGDIGGLWLIVLGWFVLGAARAEERQELLERDLGGVHVREVMTPNPVSAPDSVTVARLIDDFVLQSPGSAFPLVGSDGRVTGLATLSRCKVVPAERARSRPRARHCRTGRHRPDGRTGRHDGRRAPARDRCGAAHPRVRGRRPRRNRDADRRDAGGPTGAAAPSRSGTERRLSAALGLASSEGPPKGPGHPAPHWVRMSAMPVVALEDVTRRYHVGSETVTALDGVTLAVEAGEFTVVLGPSGSGKTTILNMVGALDVPTSGRVVIDGRDITGASRRELFAYRRATVSFIFQTFNLFPGLTARENVEFGIDVARGRHDRHAADEVLRNVGLGDRLDHFPNQLSGGEQQRVAIARALATGSRLLLADEPTGELDYRTGVQILELLREQARAGTCVMIVTHNREISRAAGPRDRAQRRSSRVRRASATAGRFPCRRCAGRPMQRLALAPAVVRARSPVSLAPGRGHRPHHRHRLRLLLRAPEHVGVAAARRTRRATA